MIIKQSYIDRIKLKDELAFEYVYEHTKHAVYSVIFAVIKNHQITEDLMQEVYMKMVKSIYQYKENSNFYNWILQIAYHHSIDHYRKYKNQVNLDITDYSKLISSQELGPDEEDKFLRMIEILDEDERLVIVLKVIEELKHRQIATILDKPLGTVIWIYQKAINKLKSVGGYDD